MPLLLLLENNGAHPRVCGENRITCPALSMELGSSPRVRGKPIQVITTAAAQRLIPACAGKTTKLSPSHRVYQAHPRVCGENDIAITDPSNRVGSSPRVRGKHVSRLIDVSVIGLIPACAGKTLCARLAGR